MKVNEIFYSIQGEGLLSGLPTIFIRTTGCNLRCSYCDTQHAYEQGTEMSINEIQDEINCYPCKTICITGGEPLLQKDLQKLITCLLKKKYRISLETNGSIDIKKFSGKTNVMISLDIKCPSSGMKESIYLKNISSLNTNDQLKCIIKDKKDYLYAKEIINRYHPRCAVFFQPVWGIKPKKLASWILDDGLPVRVGLQFHKLIWGEKKGV